jgi:hypothetical protein
MSAPSPSPPDRPRDDLQITEGIRPDVPPPKDDRRIEDPSRGGVVVTQTFGIRPDERRIDEPVPTIVGPRPEGGTGGKVSVPQGIERLLTLAATSASWKEKVLADPVAAATEANIELSDSEKAILRATPRTALSDVIKSFEKRPGMSTAAKVAVGIAAGVAATGLAVGFVKWNYTTTGIRPDAPPTGPTQLTYPSTSPVIQWPDHLEIALAWAKRENRAVMAVFLHHNASEMRSSPDTRRLSVEERSQDVLLTDSPEFLAAWRSANMIAVKIREPIYPPTPLSVEEGAQWRQRTLVYQTAVKKYRVDMKKRPTIVFLAPDGSELSRLVQPQEESQFIDAIKAVPALFAKWQNEHPNFGKGN